METYAVATMRNLPDAHPVNRLLVPHFRYTIGINSAARLKLINEGGIIDQVFSIGGKGKEELFRRAYTAFDVEGANVKENVKKRGVHDQHLLPHYYYRDDGIKVWDHIESYVKEIIYIYYGADANGDEKIIKDEEVIKDEELQKWAKDLHNNGFKGHHDTHEGHRFPDKIKSRKELIHYCTLIIFNGSAQHAAVNFGQFDIYGFIPNAPFTLQKPPPTKKGVTTFAHILESLPNLCTAGLSSGLVFALAEFSPDEVSVCIYDYHYSTYTQCTVYCV